MFRKRFFIYSGELNFVKAAIFDLDDTLVRRDDEGEDETVTPVKKLAEMINSSQDTLTIILTARAENIRDETEKLLERHDIDFDRLYMRPEKDFSLPDEKFKESVLKRLEKEGIDISFVVEDKGKVAQMWEKHRIDCLKMPEQHKVKHKWFRTLRKVYGMLPATIQKKYLELYEKRFQS